MFNDLFLFNVLEGRIDSKHIWQALLLFLVNSNSPPVLELLLLELFLPGAAWATERFLETLIEVIFRFLDSGTSSILN